MKELLLYIARNLVDDPDAVSVTEVQGPPGTDAGAARRPRRHGKGHRPAGPHRQGDPDRHPGLRPAHRPEGFRRHRRLKLTVRRLCPDTEGGAPDRPPPSVSFPPAGPPCRLRPFPHNPRGDSRGSEALVTTTEKKKKFIVDVAHLALVLALGYLALQVRPAPADALRARLSDRLCPGGAPSASSPGRCMCPRGWWPCCWWSSPTGSSAPLLALAGIRLIGHRHLPGAADPRPLLRRYILPALTDAVHLAGGPAVQAGPLPDGRAAGAADPAARHAPVSWSPCLLRLCCWAA